MKLFFLRLSLCFLLFFSLQTLRSKNLENIDTLYYEATNTILDSNALNIKKKILLDIEKKYLTMQYLPLIVIDGIPLNNSLVINNGRDSITGKFWNSNCQCYTYFFEDNYEEIKEIYYIKIPMSCRNSEILLIKNLLKTAHALKKKRKLKVIQKNIEPNN